jgi:beta-glucanase (GH16 family)
LPVPNNVIYGTLHGPDGSPRGYDAQSRRDLPDRGYETFHTYAADWYPGVVQFSVDGAVYGTATEADLKPGRKWVLDHPCYLLFTLAVGGPWPGPPPADEVFPQTMTIDYVRVTA